MAKTTEQKRLEVEEQIKQLENHRKQLMQKEKSEERKARTHRLCKRGGIVEKTLPALATFTDEQFDIFVKKVLQSEPTKRTIDKITASNTPPTAVIQDTLPTAESDTTPEPEPAVAEQVEDLL